MILLLTASCGEPAGEAGDNVPANAPVEIEALPADESSVTTTEELRNGANEPDVSNQGNSY